MYPTLAAIRENWEEGLDPLLVLPQREADHVLVLLREKENPNVFYLHRYFEGFRCWDVSVDSTGLADCYAEINRQFTEFMPPDEGEREAQRGNG